METLYGMRYFIDIRMHAYTVLILKLMLVCWSIKSLIG